MEDSQASVQAEREMARLWRIWRTVFEMLADRVCGESPAFGHS